MIQNEKTLTLDTFIQTIFPLQGNKKLMLGYDILNLEAFAEVLSFSNVETIQQTENLVDLLNFKKRKHEKK